MTVKTAPNIAPVAYTERLAGWMNGPVFRAEHELEERQEREEGPLLNSILSARRDAGLTQAQVAEHVAPKHQPWAGWRQRWSAASRQAPCTTPTPSCRPATSMAGAFCTPLTRQDPHSE